jgi:hypothetical protein
VGGAADGVIKAPPSAAQWLREATALAHPSRTGLPFAYIWSGMILLHRPRSWRLCCCFDPFLGLCHCFCLCLSVGLRGVRYGNFGVPDQREACGLRGNWGVLPGAPPGVAEARHLKYGREPLATHAVCRGSGLRGTTQVAAEVAPKGMGFDGVDGARSPAFWAQSAGHLVGQTVGMGTAHFLVQRRTGLRAPCGTTAQGRGLGGIGARRGIPEVTPSVTSPGGMEARRTQSFLIEVASRASLRRCQPRMCLDSPKDACHKGPGPVSRRPSLQRIAGLVDDCGGAHTSISPAQPLQSPADGSWASTPPVGWPTWTSRSWTL